MDYKLEHAADGSLRISVDIGSSGQGKYTFVKPDPRQSGDYGVKILRYGEPWVEHPPGENAIMDLMWLVEELHGTVLRQRVENQSMSRQLNKAIEARRPTREDTEESD